MKVADAVEERGFSAASGREKSWDLAPDTGLKASYRTHVNVAL